MAQYKIPVEIVLRHDEYLEKEFGLPPVNVVYPKREGYDRESMFDLLKLHECLIILWKNFWFTQKHSSRVNKLFESVCVELLYYIRIATCLDSFTEMTQIWSKLLRSLPLSKFDTLTKESKNMTLEQRTKTARFGEKIKTIYLHYYYSHPIHHNQTNEIHSSNHSKPTE